jgi:hypothetical protein
MVGGFLRLLPPLKLVAEILLKVALKHQKSNKIKSYKATPTNVHPFYLLGQNLDVLR